MMRTVALTLLYVASHGQVTPVWTTLVQNKQDVFAPRNGHAVAVFNDRLWLIGGRSEEYQRWDLERDVRKSDIWYTEGGSVTTGYLWRQMVAITGDFAEQQMDAKKIPVGGFSLLQPAAVVVPKVPKRDTMIRELKS